MRWGEGKNRGEESVRDQIGILGMGMSGWIELILISRGCINRRGFFICGAWLLED